MMSASRAGSSPVDAATVLISASRLSGRAVRELGGLRGLGDARRRVFGFGQEAVGDGVVVHAPQGADQVLGCAASAAGVAARGDVRLGVLGELADLQRDGSVMSLVPHASVTRFQ